MDKEITYGELLSRITGTKVAKYIPQMSEYDFVISAVEYLSELIRGHKLCEVISPYAFISILNKTYNHIYDNFGKAETKLFKKMMRCIILASLINPLFASEVRKLTQ